jgi:Tfp pilus assembly protein PilV
MPKLGTRNRRREAGFSVVEAAISAFLVAIAISGLVISVTYGQRLEASTASMWRATGAATATLEKIRSDSASRWSTLATDWNAQSCSASGLADPVTSKLTATVSSDASLLDRPTGMWTTGATEPNFLFVEIAPGATGGDLSRSLLFQTYIANREGLIGVAGNLPSDESTGTVPQGSTGGITGSVNSGGTGGSGSNSGGGGNGDTTGTSAGQVFPTASNVSLSGLLGDTLNFDLVNASSNYLPLTSVKVTGANGTKLLTVSMGNTTLVDLGSKSNVHLTSNDVATQVPAGMPPGPATFTITSDEVNLAGRSITLELTFSDKSSTTVTVKP